MVKVGKEKTAGPFVDYDISLCEKAVILLSMLRSIPFHFSVLLLGTPLLRFYENHMSAMVWCVSALTSAKFECLQFGMARASSPQAANLAFEWLHTGRAGSRPRL